MKGRQDDAKNRNHQKLQPYIAKADSINAITESGQDENPKSTEPVSQVSRGVFSGLAKTHFLGSVEMGDWVFPGFFCRVFVVFHVFYIKTSDESFYFISR